jgi:hypothetical protein
MHPLISARSKFIYVFYAVFLNVVLMYMSLTLPAASRSQLVACCADVTAVDFTCQFFYCFIVYLRLLAVAGDCVFRRFRIAQICSAGNLIAVGTLIAVSCEGLTATQYVVWTDCTVS